ncbi:replication-associated protein [Tick-associated gemycircularvirus 2]|nr:replication-associated protein [Tick-associated gemycircularvirus 2]USZ80649.1 replication-associated protein [Tick-associated gemycircularvirus 2]
MPSIQFCAQHFLLTYAHSEGRDGRAPLDPFRIVDKLGLLGGECIVAREHYPTGDGFHLHVFCSFERRFRSRKIDVFDVDGYHPNAKPSRKNALGGYDYAIKDGEVVAGGLERPSGVSGRRGTTRDEDSWAEITAAESPDEFWRLCEELDPKSMVCNFPALSRFVDWRFRPEPVAYATPDGIFDLADYASLCDWRDNVLFGGGREALGNPEAEYAVLDDIAGGIKFFPRYKDWLGCQIQFQLKVLYKEPALFNWGRPCIWCSNVDPRTGLDLVDIEWLEGNCIFVEITTPIFHANTE